MRAKQLVVAVAVGLCLVAGALAQPAQAASSFSSTPLKSIDVSRAARDQYGSSATAVLVGEHLYDWRAKVGSTLYSINMKKAAQTQYGSSYSVASVGVHAYDWRAVNVGALQNVVLPVMLIASDRFFDIQGVKDGVNRFRTVVLTTQNWYRYRSTETFSTIQPLVLYTSRTAQQWNDLSASTASSATRYALFDAAVASYKALLPMPGSKLRIATSPFVGSAPDVWLGAASGSGIAVAPQRATSITCPASGTLDSRCADATYAVGHELGHAFGLKHTCEVYASDPNCGKSIMQNGKPWNAILLSGEVTTVKASPFFTP